MVIVGKSGAVPEPDLVISITIKVSKSQKPECEDTYGNTVPFHPSLSKYQLLQPPDIHTVFLSCFWISAVYASSADLFTSTVRTEPERIGLMNLEA